MDKKSFFLLLFLICIRLSGAQPQLGIIVEKLSEKQTERILRNAMKRLNREYLKWQDEESFFILSQMNLMDGKQYDMQRAILNARSNITPRKMSILDGQACNAGGESADWHSIEGTDLYRVLQLGPMIAGGEYWSHTQTPFIFRPSHRSDGMIIEYIDLNGVENAIYNRQSFRSRYDIVSDIVQMPDGKDVVRVKLQKELPPADAYKGVGMILPNGKIPVFSVLTGTMYIDKAKGHLISFDGELTGFRTWRKQSEEISRQPASCLVHVEYTHQRGYTEIEKSICVVKCDNMESRLALTNIGPDAFAQMNKGVRIQGNLAKAIHEAGYDPELWENEAVKQAMEDCLKNHQY